jgi:hypothetical protein
VIFSVPTSIFSRFVSAAEALVFTAIFFGELRYKLAIASALPYADLARAWVLDGRGTPWESDLQTTSALLVERLAVFGGTERLRCWRPPTRFRRCPTTANGFGIAAHLPSDRPSENLRF